MVTIVQVLRHHDLQGSEMAGDNGTTTSGTFLAARCSQYFTSYRDYSALCIHKVLLGFKKVANWLHLLHFLFLP